MKRILSLILMLTLCIPLWGCTEEKVSIREPVSFYYRRSDVTYGEANSVIQAESREAAGHQDSPAYLLSQYLAGPQSEGLARTFPAGTALIRMTTEGSSVHLTLSDHISHLSGMDLTIACACITLTTIELTGAESVEIQAKTALLDDAESIIMDEHCLLLLDDAATKPAD